VEGAGDLAINFPPADASAVSAFAAALAEIEVPDNKASAVLAFAASLEPEANPPSVAADVPTDDPVPLVVPPPAVPSSVTIDHSDTEDLLQQFFQFDDPSSQDDSDGVPSLAQSPLDSASDSHASPPDSAASLFPAAVASAAATDWPVLSEELQKVQASLQASGTDDFLLPHSAAAIAHDLEWAPGLPVW
jgi:hypothetical protein